MDKENNDIPMPEIAKREENFFNGTMPTTIEGKMYYADLQRLTDGIESDIDSLQNSKSRESILRVIFFRVYDFVVDHNADYCIFNCTKELFLDVMEVSFFISVCMFLYDSKHIKGSSLRRFIYDNSPMGYGVEGSPNYFDYSRPKHFTESNSDKPPQRDILISSDEARLGQYRKRFLSKRSVHNHDVEWSAMRETSEHEWGLYFALEDADPVIKETAKRLRLLYDGVNAAIKAAKNEENITKLETAYKKFESKLKKIKYEQFLDLGKIYLEHISKAPAYYGINLYRFEKQVRLYGVTNVVNRLLNCQSKNEIYDVIFAEKAVDTIPFPKLCKHFNGLKCLQDTLHYTDMFYPFMNMVVRSSRLVIDKFVEKGIFGNDWKNLFLKLTAEMAEDVLYSPAQINYSVSDKSQEMFSLYLKTPVRNNVNQAIQDFKSRNVENAGNTENAVDTEDTGDTGSKI